MRFSGGMLGLCVTVLAVMGMVLSGFALAVQSHDETGTAWTYKTDITGLFDASQEPEYLDYSPAGNWTGFDSMGTAGSGANVIYTASTQASKYSIPGERTEAGTSTVAIGDLELTTTPLQTPSFSKNEALFIQVDDSPAWAGTGSKDTYASIFSNAHQSPTVSLLSDVIGAITLTSGVDYLEITLEAATGEIPAIVAPLTAWSQSTESTVSGGWFYYAWLDLSEWSTGRTVTIDMTQGIATVYDADGQYVTSGPTSAMTVAYNLTGYNAYDGTSVSDDLEVVQYTTDPTVYVNSSAGLELNATSVWQSPNGSGTYRYGSLEILFTTAGSDRSTTGSNTLTIPLLDAYGNSTGETLTVTVKSDQGVISASASCGSRSDSVLMGSWRTVILSIDAMGGEISVIPVSQFSGDFNGSIKRLDSTAQTLDVINTAGRSFEKITWSATDSMLFGILSSTVYLDTYGYVLVDPYIDTQEVFPDLVDVRLNFYSFALYGDSITVNGQTFAVDRSTGKINIPVEEDGETTDDWRTLTNIYLSFAGGHTSLTFADDGTTRDLGVTTTTSVSMSGTWYFTTGLWEGSTVTQKVYEWNFESFLWDGNAAVVIFLGILAVGSAVAMRTKGYAWLDYLVVITAGFMAFLLMGTSLFG